MSKSVILCDESGTPTGKSDIVKAHTGDGALHLAFSVYVFNPDRTRLIIQRRSQQKMLWPLIWANTCCSHPMEGETAIEAGQRRLSEELGFSTELEPFGSFVYRALDPQDRGIEHEYVTLLVGQVNEDMTVNPNPEEVDSWKWVDLQELTEDMARSPLLYAPWFYLGLHALLKTGKFGVSTLNIL